MKKLEKKLTCPHCGCTDAITPIDKILLFVEAAHCHQCNCVLTGWWWFNWIIIAGIFPLLRIIENFIIFLEAHTTFVIAQGGLYQWCISLSVAFLYLYIMGLISLYFIPNRVG